ncbi:MAG: PAS domain S-box protein, partial [Bacteroidota bacterium]|nr:PAS domain S-box protein [Bacteroidota bacterium]
LVGRAITNVHPGIEDTELFKAMSSCMTERKSKTMEQEFTFSDGIKRSFELRIQAVPEGLFILSMDISDRKKTEEKLRESLDRYELVNKATQDTIWEWDAHTDRITINNSFTGLYGYTKASIKNNRNLLFKNIHADDVGKLTENIKNCVAGHRSSWYDEFRFRTADGSYRSVYLKAFVQYSDKGHPQRMVGAMTDFTEKKKLEKELVDQKTKQQKLLMEVAIQSQEKEKNDLGKELHDNINQILSTVKLYLVMISKGENRPEDNLIGRSHEYVLLAIDELRKLSHSLVAPSLGDISLEEALLRLVKDANLVNSFHVNFSIEESYKKHVPDKEVELMLYRVIQEQLNNIIKYANAKNIEISLATTTSDLILRVVDNGIGFDISKKTAGIGLKNINNRVAFYNGIMNILSSETGGCRLEITIPLNACYQVKKSLIEEELATVHKN